jgi:DNA-binding transcriptional ArsR family regulator
VIDRYPEKTFASILQENTMSNPEKVARICKALSVPSRVKVLEILKVSTLCVNALANELGLTAAAVSQHLRILRDADLIRPEKRGYYVHYVVNWDVLDQWRRLVETLLTPPLDQIAGDQNQFGRYSDEGSPNLVS